MFTDRQQMPHGKYGRDKCMACHRLLGLGYDVSGRLLNLHRSTVAWLVKNRVKTTRFEGFDSSWKNIRATKSADSRLSNPVVIEEAACRVAKKAFEEYWMAHLREDRAYWTKYDTEVRRRFRHMESRDKALKLKGKKRLRADPERLAEYIERERVNRYRRKGVPEDLIPAKGEWNSLTPEEKECIHRTRRRRDRVREKVREVWYGLVGDRGANIRVGCSVKEFRDWIASQMLPSWDEGNYGSLWNFDHIRPCSSFDIFDPEECRKLNHYTNIRPCCFMENSLKSGSDPEERLLMEWDPTIGAWVRMG